MTFASKHPRRRFSAAPSTDEGTVKVRLLIICTVVAGSRLSAQDYPAPSAQRTSEVSDARCESVQSPRSRSFTFRIDRYTGTAWQLTQLEKERWLWEETRLPDAPSVRRQTARDFSCTYRDSRTRRRFSSTPQVEDLAIHQIQPRIRGRKAGMDTDGRCFKSGTDVR